MLYYFGLGAEYDMNNYNPMMRENHIGKVIRNDPYGFSKYIMSKIAKKVIEISPQRIFSYQN